MISLGLRASARATPIRWRWPPENGVVATHMLAHETHDLQKFKHPCFSLMSVCHSVDEERLSYNVKPRFFSD